MNPRHCLVWQNIPYSYYVLRAQINQTLFVRSQNANLKNPKVYEFNTLKTLKINTLKGTALFFLKEKLGRSTFFTPS